MHKNTQKRIYNNSIYFITCNTQDKIPFFENKELCEIWLSVLDTVKNIKWVEILAFCLNYDHFHLLLKPNNKIANISQIMQSFKKNSSININSLLWLNEMGSSKSLSSQTKDKLKNLSKFQRQKSFHDHIIRDEKDYFKHLKYTENNYIKHWLPDDWKYTSKKTKI